MMNTSALPVSVLSVSALLAVRTLDRLVCNPYSLPTHSQGSKALAVCVYVLEPGCCEVCIAVVL